MKSFTNEELKLLLLSVVNMYNEVNSKKENWKHLSKRH